MAEEDDLITIVDVTDPDDPSYGDVKTRRRALTDAELATLRPMLEKVGAYKFFTMEFNFADGPAVKQFIESVELEEFKRTKQRKIVQDNMKGNVAGREVVINAELIEKAFSLVDDGENISKPKGETNGLHAFYIKPKYVHLCQNYRGVYLKLFKSEYSYFINMAHQIQAYCCGGSSERQITLTQYRAIDLMIRGKPVNWNRYLLQNFQDKVRKYKAGPCPLYFGGTLTALIYKALHVDYSLVNKPLLISPQTPERITAADAERGKKREREKEPQSKGKDQRLVKDSGPPKKREAVRRQVGAMTRAQRMLAGESLVSERLDDLPSSKSRTAAATKALQDRKRKRAKHRVKLAKKQKTLSSSGKQKRLQEIESEPSVMEEDGTEDEAAPGSPLSLPASPVSTPATAPPALPAATPYTPATTNTPATVTPATTAPFTTGGLKWCEGADKFSSVGRELVLSSGTDRLAKLFAQAHGSPRDPDTPEETLALTASKDLWGKYEHLSALQQEYHLEHIVSKQMLEQSLQRVQELEDALKEKDRKLSELESSKVALEEKLSALANNHESEDAAQAPLKVRLKVGQKKQSDDSAAPSPEDSVAAMEEKETSEKDKEKANEDGEDAGAGEGVEVIKDKDSSERSKDSSDKNTEAINSSEKGDLRVKSQELDTMKLKAIEEQVAAVAKAQEEKEQEKEKERPVEV